jgi:hypothetical protein
MRGLAIRLGIPLVLVLVAVQFLLPPVLEKRVADRVTDHGGSADVELSAFPSVRLLFGHGRKLGVNARGLSVDLNRNQQDVFKQLDDFGDVSITVLDSRAGPFTVRSFHVQSTGKKTYDVVIAGDGTAGDVARYAGSRLGGGFGQALAGLATAALGGFDQPVPFDARMQISTVNGAPQAENVNGQVAGLPAGPLAQVVANALLSGL